MNTDVIEQRLTEIRTQRDRLRVRSSTRVAMQRSGGAGFEVRVMCRI